MINSNRKKILLAVDGSNQSLEAVRYASRVFPSKKINVVLFHVFSEIPEFFYDLGEKQLLRQGVATIIGLEMALRDSMDKFMSEARQILIDSGIPPEAITIDIHDREAGIARDIIAESRHGYSAVIVGRNGLNKINDFVLGSLANKLLESLSDVSICVVGEKPAPRRVILALDESEGAMKAVDYVGTMLGESTHEVTLFYVVRGSNVFKPRFERVVNLMPEKEWLEEAKLVAKSVFGKATTRLVDAGFDPKQVTTKMITGASSRAGAIVQEAEEGNYGTIVVGRRGVSKVQEFSMGRVSNKVIQLAKRHAVWLVI
ncbi:MAG: universal stress protein [Desulfobacteraceae bacterium]|nr:MAG: universal stress protein [Desulfobacteraceae bacterium]